MPSCTPPCRPDALPRLGNRRSRKHRTSARRLRWARRSAPARTGGRPPAGTRAPKPGRGASARAQLACRLVQRPQLRVQRNDNVSPGSARGPYRWRNGRVARVLGPVELENRFVSWLNAATLHPDTDVVATPCCMSHARIGGQVMDTLPITLYEPPRGASITSGQP